MQTAARGVSFSSRISSFSSTSSRPDSKRVFIEASDAVLRSNICWRYRSFAAAVPSGSFQQQKGQKRVSKQERRALVEEFVDRYRASNAGRFPTISHAQQQIGGSFYIIRQIIQELEYNHKASLKTIVETRSGKVEKVIYPNSVAKKEPSLLKVEKSLNSCTTESGSSHKQSVEFGVRSDMKVISGLNMDEDPPIKDGEAIRFFEAKEPHISADAEKALAEEPISHLTTVMNYLSKQIVEDVENSSVIRQTICDAQIDIKVHKKEAPSRLANENWQDTDHDSTKSQADSSVPVKLETKVDILQTPPRDIQGSRKDISSTVGLQDANGPKGAVEQRSNEEVSKSDKLIGDDPRMFEEGASSPKRLNIWGNLKSLANGIISLWKKM